MKRGNETCSAREGKKRRVRRWQFPRAAMAISACGVWHFRVRRLAFPRAAFETLPAMSKKSLPRKNRRRLDDFAGCQLRIIVPG